MDIVRSVQRDGKRILQPIDNVENHVRTLEYQRQVVDKFAQPNMPSIRFVLKSVTMLSIDCFMNVNADQLHHDVILVLDIDCIPLCEGAIEYFVSEAALSLNTSLGSPSSIQLIAPPRPAGLWLVGLE